MKTSLFGNKNKFFRTSVLLAMLLFHPFLFAYGQSEPTAFKVEVTGTGKPMILIPGLSCSGEVWDETVDRYRKEYECHVLTLAGFAGHPAIKSNKFLDTVRDELAAYIRQQKLHKPVLAGHSLGGFLGLSLGIKEPDLLGALLIVDSAPFLPDLIVPGITPEGAENMAKSHLNYIQNQTDEQFRQTQPQILSTLITDEARVKKAAEWSFASDGNTMGKAMYELYTTDLRAELGAIKVPVMVMASWIAYKPYGTTHESIEKSFNQQYKNLPDYRLVIYDEARHFIMWDDPEGFYAALDSFLSARK